VRWKFLSCIYKIFLRAYNSAKIILKNPSRFSRVMIINVLPPFYGSQCIGLWRWACVVCVWLGDWRFRDADFTGKATDWEQTEGEEEADAQDAVHARVGRLLTVLQFNIVIIPLRSYKSCIIINICVIIWVCRHYAHTVVNSWCMVCFVCASSSTKWDQCCASFVCVMFFRSAQCGVRSVLSYAYFSTAFYS